MNKEENILIAEFMDIDIYDIDHDGHVKFINPTKDAARVITLRYDEYNDLMPVVEKISTDLNIPFDETFGYLTSGITGDNIWNIEDLYSAIVEYIKLT